MPDSSPMHPDTALAAGPGVIEQALEHQLQRLLPTHHWLCRAPSFKRKQQWFRRLLDETSHAVQLQDSVVRQPARPAPARPWARHLAVPTPPGTLADFAVTSWLLDSANPPAQPDSQAHPTFASACERIERRAIFHRRQAFELLLAMTQKRQAGLGGQVQAAIDRQWPHLLARLAGWPADEQQAFMARTLEQLQFLGCRAGTREAKGVAHG
ncbi:hypothetical protein [Pseudomonas sp. RIT-To-2]|uniref:hypothetical protein n=1 Tax=Pseudomonas sp. RIT-To-2 TaxID=3462541 RepID=UPI0024134A97